ncbi:MAG: DUF2314 domain-containing protein [Cyanobacteria bacterium]|nr:DUF2314 domain-containing protein [Cyanobacteriota bacterium]
MADDSKETVYMFESKDPEMLRAYERARESFRYFFRELSWEKRRIVPALDLAFVKVPFSDTADADPESEGVEHMWLDEVDFDGKMVSGKLINSPNWLKSCKIGDSKRIAIGEISDWMYSIYGRVFGAHTVNLMRSRMSPRERKEHDEAWGLEFGDPNDVRVIFSPEADKPRTKGLGGLFGKKKSEEPTSQPDLDAEHPMSESMAESLKDSLSRNPAMVYEKDDRGWTLLHQEALAGNTATVKVLLEHGADPKLRTDHGMTARDLAQTLQWNQLMLLLSEK